MCGNLPGCMGGTMMCIVSTTGSHMLVSHVIYQYPHFFLLISTTLLHCALIMASVAGGSCGSTSTSSG